MQAARYKDAVKAGFGALAVALFAFCAIDEVSAQTESVQDMIQQLQLPQGGKRTRGMRNLNVEATSLDAEIRPSISLQIQFDFDSATVRPESMAAIERLSRAIGSPELASHRFAIEGHTDAQGRTDYNRRLSDLRAARVKDILVQAGVDSSRLYAVGKGSSELANPSDPLSGENRRVKIINLN